MDTKWRLSITPEERILIILIALSCHKSITNNINVVPEVDTFSVISNAYSKTTTKFTINIIDIKYLTAHTFFYIVSNTELCFGTVRFIF